jgi:hypothetical protein
MGVPVVCVWGAKLHGSVRVAYPTPYGSPLGRGVRYLWGDGLRDVAVL